jgi:hypothetical protein
MTGATFGLAEDRSEKPNPVVYIGYKETHLLAPNQ